MVERWVMSEPHFNNDYLHSRPKVAILLATFNALPWLVEQIDSIFLQEQILFHIYISDDSSVDGTQIFLKKIEAVDPRISCIYSMTQSGSAGVNFYNLILNTNLAGYDFVAYCDQDDIWDKSKLINAINSINHNSASGYSSSVVCLGANLKNKVLIQNSNARKLDYLFEGAGQGCTFVIPIQKFIEFKAFLSSNRELVYEFFYHDWLTYLFIRCTGGKWYFSRLPSMKYRQHSNNETGARIGVSAIKLRFIKIYNGWYANQIGLAIRLANLINPADQYLQKFTKYFSLPPSIYRKFNLIFLLFCFGRRRISDRIVLVCSAILGLI